jgi:Ca2+-binding RTX toxin-like protein
MATIPGGAFDTTTNPNITPVQAAEINSFFTSLGITESQFTNIATLPGGGNILSTNDLSTIVPGNITPNQPILINIPFLTQPISFTLPSSGVTIVFGGFTGTTALSTLQTAQELTNGGTTISDAQAKYLVDAAVDFGASTTMVADLQKGLQLLSKNGTALPENLLVNFVRLAQAATSTTGEIKLDVSNVTKDFLLAAYLPDLKGATLALAGMEKILVLGAGTVKIDGGQPGMIVGDRFNQVIIGGGGSDTLVGGGGNDTLTGGSSPDVFGFNALGHYTITDFITGYDKLAFEIPGVTSKAALQGFLTSVTNTGGDTKFNFGTTASITLVGVNASGLFDDMLFNIS